MGEAILLLLDNQSSKPEVTLVVNSELLAKAMSKGIDLSSALEQQLNRTLSDR
ncbi:MAG: type II toxin-antitoxin system CcdA family antitoxin [Nitrososphaeraceae archaeon]